VKNWCTTVSVQYLEKGNLIYILNVAVVVREYLDHLLNFVINDNPKIS